MASTVFYKVPFQQALPLIKNRSVYLENGYAFVPLTQVVSLIIVRFRMSLSKALAEASLMFQVGADDPRIGPLVKNMNKMYTGKDFLSPQSSIDKLTPDKVDQAAGESKNIRVLLG